MIGTLLNGMQVNVTPICDKDYHFKVRYKTTDIMLRGPVKVEKNGTRKVSKPQPAVFSETDFAELKTTRRNKSMFKDEDFRGTKSNGEWVITHEYICAQFEGRGKTFRQAVKDWTRQYMASR